ncbi:MAG: ROK family protein [Planctomycetia bacterium]|nr:ROK family protein [Planctomycetia bacterium]
MIGRQWIITTDMGEEPVYLGIEIGGTKLQWIVGTGQDTSWLDRRLTSVDRHRQADGILEQLEEITGSLITAHPEIRRIGIGFGGPVDPKGGRVIRSHQIDGWQNFPLAAWMEERFHRPAILANDSDCAGLAEAMYGAGRGAMSVFYSNVGSGIGGALVIRGNLYTGSSGIASEIGHLRPTPVEQSRSPSPDTPDVESMASGWAITEYVRRRCELTPESAEVLEILKKVGGSTDQIDTRKVVRCALEDRNPIAMDAMNQCTRVYGWALAQMITLLSPEVVVIGGGVSLADRSLFLDPLREQVSRNVFPALRGTYRLVPAALGEEVVAAGSLASVIQRENETETSHSG